MAKQIDKKRNWAFVVYPESLPEEWLDILQQTGLQCAISPLHDKDTEPDGQPKKPHYHVIVCYSGPTSYNVVKGLTNKLNGPAPIMLEQVRGMYRYHIHLDNPEKYQYDDKQRKMLNGFNITDYVEMTKSEVLRIKGILQTMIREADLLEYSDFMDILQDSDTPDYYDVASTNTFFFEKYISSRRNKQKPGHRRN